MVQSSNHVKAKPDIFDENNSSVCEKKRERSKKVGFAFIASAVKCSLIWHLEIPL